MNLKIKEIGNITGIISLVVFIVCVNWGFLLTTLELKQFHLNLIQVLYPGYALNFVGIILGLIESYIYGWLIGASFVWLCKKICK